MLRDTWTVYLKELREVIRDRRTLIFMLAFPLLLVPLIGNITVDFMTDASREAATKTLGYAAFGEHHAPGLADRFDAEHGFERIELEDPAAVGEALRTEQIDFAIVIQPPHEERAVVELHYDNAPVFGGVEKRVEPVVQQYNEARRDQRLAEVGYGSDVGRKALLEPVELQPHGIASEREVLGERMGGMLPYVLIVFCFLGALYPAIDLGAGEKERGTLETLLLAPVSRLQLVLGKFLVVFTTGAIAAGLGTLSFGTWLASKGSGAEGAMGELIAAVGVGDVLLIAALTLPIAAIFAAALLSISIYAKSFKEAQSYIAPLNMLMLIPAFLAMLPGVELDARWAMIPVSNVALAIKEIVKGTITMPILGLVFASSFVFAVALIAGCAQWFRRESVLFRA